MDFKNKIALWSKILLAECKSRKIHRMQQEPKAQSNRLLAMKDPP
jgi:hypothetical protein